MMKAIVVAVLPAMCLSTVAACSGSAAESDAPNVSTTEEALTACPAPPWDDAQQRALATLALNIMRLAGQAAGTQTHAIQAYSVLATQRYSTLYPKPGIQFDPTDPLYSYVTDAMKAELVFAQLDNSVAVELNDSLWNNKKQTDGEMYASIAAVQNIGAFKGPGPYTSPVLDHSGSSHMATVTSSSWCGTQLVTVAESDKTASTWAPIFARDISDWRTTVPSGFVGTQHIPTTVFNGDLSWGNPYLVVSLNGTATSWTKYNFGGADCSKLPSSTCYGTLQVDPIPYAEPGAYYDGNNNLVGPQPNPFGAIGTALYADSAHENQWATRTVNNVQEWGQFSTAVTIYGVTKYQYVKRY